MTPLEELQAAHKRLSKQLEDRERVNLSLLPPHAPISVFYRSLDAQMAILANAIGRHQSWMGSLKDVDLLPLEVALARAINEAT